MTGAPVRPTLAFMARHPARWIALGFGSGLAPRAPGTVGTLWAWAAFAVLSPWMSDAAWALLIGIGTVVGWWACTRCAQHMKTPDPGSIVWDEVLAFWVVLWLIAPASFVGQAIAFGLFRFFDAAKPGPVGWADRLFKAERGVAVGWRQGLGILIDDFVAAGCTLAVIALYRFLMG
ncbi:phosphatidylglycerophosphatase A [Roseateles sp. DC23W]|uniref:Phosphatidylglycerophosphatase A n=1 Tax=Pelomonas dachongensis TaxID=3299029 RepID=A0ABW7EN71_9BURK